MSCSPSPDLPWDADAARDPRPGPRRTLERARSWRRRRRWPTWRAGSTRSAGDGHAGVRRLQRAVRLDVRGRLLLAVPGPQPVRLCRARPEGAVHGSRRRRAAGRRRPRRDVAGPLSGRRSRTRTRRSTTPGCRRPSPDGCCATRAERRATDVQYPGPASTVRGHGRCAPAPLPFAHATHPTGDRGTVTTASPGRQRPPHRPSERRLATPRPCSHRRPRSDPPPRPWPPVSSVSGRSRATALAGRPSPAVRPRRWARR